MGFLERSSQKLGEKNFCKARLLSLEIETEVRKVVIYVGEIGTLTYVGWLHFILY